jgi:hypothetical protein
LRAIGYKRFRTDRHILAWRTVCGKNNNIDTKWLTNTISEWSGWDSLCSIQNVNENKWSRRSARAVVIGCFKWNSVPNYPNFLLHI